jgi:hypothetical protein
VRGRTVYAGGRFTKAGGKARRNLAALDGSKGKVTDWNPRPSGAVRALAISRDTVYVGGQFGSIGGASRRIIAGLDAATGRATRWNPAANGAVVVALAISDGKVYVGGRFKAIGGRARHNVAAIDTTTGRSTSWDPRPVGDVVALAASGSTIYAGGSFTAIGGQPHRNLAALDSSNGNATDWSADTGGRVIALATSPETVYAAGRFTSIGGRLRHGLAALDAQTGTLTGWNPGLGGPGLPRGLAVSGSTVYVVGNFSEPNGPRRDLVALDASTGAPTNFSTPGIYSAPLAVSGSTVYTKDVDELVGLNAATGDIVTTARTDGGVGVSALAVSGSTVYVGGDFTSIGNQPRTGLAAVDASTGEVTNWHPNVGRQFGTARVDALAVSGSAVYIGGDFTSIGDQPRLGLGAVDASTGAPTNWNPNSSADAGLGFTALTVAGRTIYVAGGFKMIGGERRFGLAAVDDATGTVTGWAPEPTRESDHIDPAPIHALATSGSTIYAGGDFTWMGPVAQQGFAEFTEH